MGTITRAKECRPPKDQDHCWRTKIPDVNCHLIHIPTEQTKTSGCNSKLVPCCTSCISQPRIPTEQNGNERLQFQVLALLHLMHIPTSNPNRTKRKRTVTIPSWCLAAPHAYPDRTKNKRTITIPSWCLAAPRAYPNLESQPNKTETNGYNSKLVPSCTSCISRPNKK